MMMDGWMDDDDDFGFRSFAVRCSIEIPNSIPNELQATKAVMDRGQTNFRASVSERPLCCFCFPLGYL